MLLTITAKSGKTLQCIYRLQECTFLGLGARQDQQISENNLLHFILKNMFVNFVNYIRCYNFFPKGGINANTNKTSECVSDEAALYKTHFELAK